MESEFVTQDIIVRLCDLSTNKSWSEIEEHPYEVLKILSREHHAPAHQLVAELSRDPLVWTIALDNEVPPGPILYERDGDGDFHWWPDIGEASATSTISADIADNSFLGIYSQEISKSVQFPLNTVFLHGLGVVSSALVRQFRFELYGKTDNPVNLFTVASQPPGTGKTGVNGAFHDPIREAYNGLNKNQEMKRAELTEEIEALVSEKKTATTPQAKSSYAKKIAETKQELDATPIYMQSANDGTPEGLERLAGAQNGMVNVISDESDAINVILGSAYGGDRKTNHGVFLKMFDGGWIETARAGRDGYRGKIYGSFAVLAQDESIEGLLKAGLEGRGITERVLMMKEKPILGERTHGARYAINPEIERKYILLINNLVNAPATVLKFHEEGAEAINRYRQAIEPELADGGKYCSTMLRGAAGKNDKIICKIASILHCIDHFQESPTGSSLVEKQTVLRAIEIYDKLFKSYVAVVGNAGYAGDDAVVKVIIEKLRDMADSKDMAVNIRKLYKRIEKSPAMKGVEKPTQYIRTKCLPVLIRGGYLAADGDNLFINPKINKHKEGAR